VYKYLHSADLHATLRNASTRAIPDFSEHLDLSGVCKRVLSAELFKASYDSFAEDTLAQLDLCLKVCVPLYTTQV
jgi:hypothetical protein